MRLADYVARYLEDKGVKHIFMLSGGGMMYLMDAVGRSNIEYVCCHHEQAAGIAAVGYALESNGLGVCMVTTGPGGTNALTAAGAAYVDSTPVLFISGQVKTADFASLRNVRQYGAQENDIVSMAKPVTKYAVTVTDKDQIRYYLERAVYEALNGRRGPVWIDIPLDIQNADIDPEVLVGYRPDEQDPEKQDYIKQSIADLFAALEKAKRPLFLAGHGLKAAGAEEKLTEIVRKTGVPVLTTWRELALFDDDDELFFGSPGLQARRYSNLILQGADLLIVLGSRLDNMITAFSEEHFAFRAKKYIVDIDENELNKYKMPECTGIRCDISVFIDELYSELGARSVNYSYKEWISKCRALKERYPISKERQNRELSGVDLYKMTQAISYHSTKYDDIVISSTSRCNTAGHIAFSHKKGQRLISSMGFGSMGFALPHVVGAWFASDAPSDKRRVLMIEGDGSLQLNIQELQTIIHHKINAKLFIFSNVGYAAIATMQDRNFEGFHVGSDADSGVTLPDMGKIAAAYGMEYRLIEDDSQIDDTVSEVMDLTGPVICEFRGSIEYDEIPKCISSLDENGNRVSAALENPYPFLSQSEMDEIYRNLL
ncbi:MAG: thiamine pyrophosphate-binding protein [Lachnospiraceae bacterium]|nr:thiamine pyrophosphate-binding protein [Lachnospiraceae bacterium]